LDVFKESLVFSGNAVEGCANALREELKPFGIDVVTLDSSSVPAEALFSAPLPYCKRPKKRVRRLCDS
jgi:short-subunit dehydrogenase